MKSMPFIGLLVLAIAANAASADEIALQTDKGPVKLHIIHHASFVLHWNARTIYVDPTGSADLYKGQGEPDLILITHAHGDHFSPDTLAAINTGDSILVMPKSVADKAGKHFGKSQHTMSNGDMAEFDGVQIRAMPMYNLPQSPDAYHPKGWGNAYVLTLGNKRIYISGDTSGIAEMRELEHIDLAFVCMNLPYTMDAAHAADAVLAFRPKVVYPYHYRGQDTKSFKKIVDSKDPAIKVRLRDWYPDAGPS